MAFLSEFVFLPTILEPSLVVVGARSLAQREFLQRSRDAENVEFLGAKA